MSTLARRLAAASAVAAVSVATILVGAPAHAVDPASCGDVILTNTVLAAALVRDGTTNGLIIGAPGVTLDLRGHKISGPGAYATQYARVHVTQLSRVTVTRGIVTGFQSGVVLNEAWGNTASKITAIGYDQGINLAGVGGHLVRQSSVAQNGRDVLRLGLSTQNTITQNTVHLVSRNVVTESRWIGLNTFGGATGTTFQQNTVSGNSQEGVVAGTDTTANLVISTRASATTAPASAWRMPQ